MAMYVRVARKRSKGNLQFSPNSPMAKNHKSPPKKPAHKPAPKTAPKKAAPAPARTAAVKAAPNGKPAKDSPPMEKPSKKTALRDKILKRKAAPIAFSLDEAREIAKTVTSKTATPFPAKAGKAAAAKNAAAAEKPKPQHVKAASLSDILGFNPKRGKPAETFGEKDVQEKFKRYYKLLLDLRAHLT